jgi:ribosomal protein L7Ae-like RNA K-turn-binding protein
LNQDKLKGFIGLSRRAGQLSLGTDTVLKQLKSGAAGVVLLDSAAAQNTAKRLAEAAQYAGIPVFVLPEGLLDLAAGQSGRIAAAVRRGSLADQIILLCNTAEKA